MDETATDAAADFFKKLLRDDVITIPVVAWYQILAGRIGRRQRFENDLAWRSFAVRAPFPHGTGRQTPAGLFLVVVLRQTISLRTRMPLW